MDEAAEREKLNLLLKNEFKMANKWFQQDIGETFELLTFWNGSNRNWKEGQKVSLICNKKKTASS